MVNYVFKNVNTLKPKENASDHKLGSGCRRNNETSFSLNHRDQTCRYIKPILLNN